MKLYNASYRKFIEYVKGRDVVCYGAGKMLDEMEASIPELPFFCNSISVVDGDGDKHGKKRNIYGEELIIRDIECLKNKKDIVIIVTSGAIYEILENLQRLVSDETPTFIFYLMRREKYEHDVITVIDDERIIGMQETEQIPKIIHYFWFGKKEIPDNYKKNIETWRKYCSSYEFKLWDENNCDLEECIYAEQAYMHGKYGFVPDYFRLKRIYEYGGIYLDLDVELIKPLDELRYLDAYAGMEDNNYVNFGSGFGAKKQFPIIKEMFEIYEREKFEKADGTLNLCASPYYQTNVLKKHGYICNGKMQSIEGMTILPMNYLTVQSPHTGRRYISKNSFSIHKYAASWVSESERKKKEYLEELYANAEMI